MTPSLHVIRLFLCTVKLPNKGTLQSKFPSPKSHALFSNGQLLPTPLPLVENIDRFIISISVSSTCLRYQILFTNRRVIWYMTGMFVWCLSWTSTILFESPLEVTESGRKCVFRELITNLSASRTWVVTYCVVSVLVPFLVTMATYFHLRLAVRKRINRNRNTRVRKRAELEIRLSRMGILVALFMAICFVPNQISYILVRFDVFSLLSPGHNATVVLSMLNSCINPFIYCSSNRAYRREFIRLFCLCRQNRVTISSTDEVRLQREHVRYRDSLHGVVQHADTT